MVTHISTLAAKTTEIKSSEDNCPCEGKLNPCPVCGPANKVVYVINYEKHRIEEALLMGLSKDNDRAWVKVDAGNFNEVVDTRKENLYDTAEEAQRAMFKKELAGVWKKK